MRESQKMSPARGEIIIINHEKFNPIGILLVGIALLFVGWFVIGFILKAIGWLILASLALIGGGFLFKKDDPNYYDKMKPGLEALVDKFKKDRPDLTVDGAFKIVMIASVLMFFYSGMSLITVASYANDPAYQHMPVNYIGFATMGLLGFMMYTTIKTFLMLPSMRTEPMPERQWYAKALSRAAYAAMIVYPLCILAVNAGVL
jgi:hypothetical protein